jgi:hypothetical protein
MPNKKKNANGKKRIPMGSTGIHRDSPFPLEKKRALLGCIRDDFPDGDE